MFCLGLLRAPVFLLLLAFLSQGGRRAGQFSVSDEQMVFCFQLSALLLFNIHMCNQLWFYICPVWSPYRAEILFTVAGCLGLCPEYCVPPAHWLDVRLNSRVQLFDLAPQVCFIIIHMGWNLYSILIPQLFWSSSIKKELEWLLMIIYINLTPSNTGQTQLSKVVLPGIRTGGWFPFSTGPSCLIPSHPQASFHHSFTLPPRPWNPS